MDYYTASLAPQLAPLRCRGLIVYVGAAGLVIMAASDSELIEITIYRSTCHSYCHVV